MSNMIKVFAPATVANVGCGYDVLGFALEGYGDTMEVNLRNDEVLKIISIDGAVGIPLAADENVATVAIKSLLKTADLTAGFDIKISKNIAAGSGLGSSASSSAAAVYAVNELLGRPFEKHELIAFAMEGERVASGAAHADNVAPSLLGGFTIVRDYHPLDVINIPYPEDLLAVILYPQVTIKTSDAKRIVKQQIKLSKAISQWGNVAGLVAGLIMKDHALIGRSLKDEIIEPVRSMLIPKYDEVKRHCMDAGALGFNISGSGPSMFALTNDKSVANRILTGVPALYEQEGIELFKFVSAINSLGTISI
ncbi:MAG: homoserine kinase [Cyclobacteriaceae bacterium]|jgi:homoserine kinase